jgi:hypothetical protein
VHAPNRSCGAASESAADHAAIKYNIVCLARSWARHSLEAAGHRWPVPGRAHTLQNAQVDPIYNFDTISHCDCVGQWSLMHVTCTASALRSTQQRTTRARPSGPGM